MSDVRGRRQQQQGGSASAGSSPSKDTQTFTPSSLAGRANAAPFVPGPRESKEAAASALSQPAAKPHSSPRPGTAGGRQGGGRQGSARGVASPRTQASTSSTLQDSPKPAVQLGLALTSAGFGADSIKAAPFIPIATADGATCKLDALPCQFSGIMQSRAVSCIVHDTSCYLWVRGVTMMQLLEDDLVIRHAGVLPWLGIVYVAKLSLEPDPHCRHRHAPVCLKRSFG